MNKTIGPRLTPEQWQALHWLASPTAYAAASRNSAYASLGDFVRYGRDGRWRSTAKGRLALAWYPIWSALDRAATCGVGHVSPHIAKKLVATGIVVDLGGRYPTLDRAVKLTPAGHRLVSA